VVGLEFFGQSLGGRQSLGRVRLGEDEGQPFVGDLGQLLGQMPLYVPPLMGVMEMSP
jgi:hypothetical protein